MRAPAITLEPIPRRFGNMYVNRYLMRLGELELAKGTEAELQPLRDELGGNPVKAANLYRAMKDAEQGQGRLEL